MRTHLADGVSPTEGEAGDLAVEIKSALGLLAWGGGSGGAV